MRNSRTLLFSVLGVTFLLSSLYAVMGVLQAASLFTGPRAFSNANFWGSVWLVALVFSVLCFWQVCGGTPKFLVFPAWLKVVVGICLVVLALWFLSPVIADLLAIDRCLDNGGSFNHVESVCDLTVSHPHMSTFERQGFRLVTFVVLLIWGALLVLPIFSRRGNKHHVP